jgi:FKBP-type peptidyl-prolyl cis-trans isomerase
MKYVSIAIVVIFIGIMVASWLRKTPEAPTVPETVTPTNEIVQQEQGAPEKTTTSNKRVLQGMTIETTKEGTGDAITNGKTAVVHYTGKFENGTVFDSSKTRGTPFEFQLGAGMVIKGWDLGVLGMKVGETRMLTIPSDLAYGASGIPGAIPGGATLIFEVELLGIK